MVKVFYQQAIKWYTLAAEQGYFKCAGFNLAIMYDFCTGVLQDYKDQVNLWFMQVAAKQGDCNSTI